jgi:hypothetical protein
MPPLVSAGEYIVALSKVGMTARASFAHAVLGLFLPGGEPTVGANERTTLSNVSAFASNVVSLAL